MFTVGIYILSFFSKTYIMSVGYCYITILSFQSVIKGYLIKGSVALIVHLDCYSLKGILDVHCGDIYFMFFYITYILAVG